MFESLQHKYEGGYSSIGRATVCGTVGFLFKPGFPPMKLLLLIPLFSSALLVRKDQSILFAKYLFSGLYVLISGKYTCLILTLIITVVVFVVLPIVLTILIVRWKGWKYMVFTYAYLFNLVSFYQYCINSNSSTLFGMSFVIISFITFLILSRNSFNSKTSLSNSLVHMLNMSKEMWFILITVSLLIRCIRINFMEYLNLEGLDLSSQALIFFSLLLPTFILFQILYNAFIYAPHSIFFSILLQLTIIENYNVKNVHLGNIFIFCYSLAPFGITVTSFFYGGCISMWCNYSVNSVEVSPKFARYGIFSYEDISIPNDCFENHVNLNEKSSKQLMEVSKSTPIVYEIGKGDGKLRDYAFVLDGKTYVRWNDGKYYEISYLKTRFTCSIDKFKSVPVRLNIDYDLQVPNHYLHNPSIIPKLENLTLDKYYESKVDAMVATMMPHFFGTNKGFGFCPQARDSDVDVERCGKIDFLIDYNNKPIVIIENKTHVKSSDSWLALMQQAQRYCTHNDHHEVVFVIVFKCSFMSAFFYDQDFHTSRGFNLKHENYQDLIGLHVTNQGVRLLPQSNTFYPQMRIYKMGLNASKDDQFAVSSILNYISNFKNLDNIEVTKDFTLPPHHGPSNIVARIPATSTFRPGLNLSLKIDPFGRNIICL